MKSLVLQCVSFVFEISYRYYSFATPPCIIWCIMRIKVLFYILHFPSHYLIVLYQRRRALYTFMRDDIIL